MTLTLSNHPVWQGVSAVKRSGHLLRFFLAKQYARSIPRSKLIGITGSVGKTTATLACQSVLSERFTVLSTTQTLKGVVNLDPVFNLPMTILRVKKSTDKVLLELGIEHPGEILLFLSLVKPATGIVTRLSYQHTQFLTDLDAIVREKGKLIEQLPKEGYAILNWDDVNVRKLASKTAAQVVFYGLDKAGCHVWADNIKIQNFQTSFELNYGVERVVVTSHLLGKHLVYPQLAAAALGISLDMPLVSIKKGLEKLEPGEHRLQPLEGLNGSVILDDTYNAAPVSVEEAIDVLMQIPARRHIMVLGEMRELGDFSEKMHRDIARKIFKERVDLVFTGRGEAKFVADELKSLGFIPDRLSANLSNPQIVSKLLPVLGKGDVVLVKGARAVKLEEVVGRLSRHKR